MARRFSKEEKGKSITSRDKDTHITRIKAPCVDNAALIKENALTLIGRVTNLQEQKIWALLPALPRKWHLQGSVTGSDLGNGYFQFRFEREEDLRRVLDNRPYHFSYWMVIIQRWEPVISHSFPSQIPFWIRIKGLPLHFWMDEVVCSVGKELGTLVDHELTKTTARVRVLVDGFKPLIKKAVMEYDSGEESIIYLDYEKLENHCSWCSSLTHLKKDCPSYLMERQQEVATFEEASPARIETQISNRDTATNHYYRGADQQTTERYRSDPSSKQHTTAFHERVDRHGNNFGARIGSKQTRVPPPVRSSDTKRGESTNWRRKEVEQEPRPVEYNSPPYTTRREPLRETGAQRKHLFPQKGLSEWRVKPAGQPLLLAPQTVILAGNPQSATEQNQHNLEAEETPKRQTEESIISELNEATLRYLNYPDPTEAAARRQRVMAGDARGQTEETAAGLLLLRTGPPDQRERFNQQQNALKIPTKDQILQELQDVTKQYLSCANPIEAAARQRRVLESDAEGLTERAAESILAATANQRRPLSPWERGIRSVSPPGIDFNEAMQPSDAEVTPPPAPCVFASHYAGPSSPENPPNPMSKGQGTSRLQSIIISPVLEVEEDQVPQREMGEVADDEETLRNYQNKTVSQKPKQVRIRPPRLSPNILRGASSKKRKLSQLQQSPSCGSKRVNRGLPRDSGTEGTQWRKLQQYS
ncbi:Uncharacterized protein Rs2_40040 [Raphanus sativus]|nr:Uncharacterized protein Rs2_40038 [Raphanus sativus]KAJ4875022.1 Uncharacterized protein Rs2_40040 [Raphanus sativus]